MPGSTAVDASRRPKAPSHERGRQAYLWVAPAVLVVVAILLYPVVRAAQLSLTSTTTFLPGEFVGFDNYWTLLTSDLFWQSTLNNLILLISVPVSIAVALFVAGLVYRGIAASRIYETLIFLPFLPAVASIATIFVYLLSSDGPVNAVLSGVGIDSRGWLTDPSLAIWSILGVVTWKRIGFMVMLFTARLTSLDRSLFEAASVDGAKWGRTFWTVAVPQMKGIIVFATVLSFIEIMSWSFAYVLILTNGGPDRSTFTLEFMLYDTQFVQNLLGLASALAVILFVVALLVAIYRVRIARRELAFG